MLVMLCLIKHHLILKRYFHIHHQSLYKLKYKIYKVIKVVLLKTKISYIQIKK